MSVDVARVCDFWESEAGQYHIFFDKITAQLTHEELIGDGSEHLHGRLVAMDSSDADSGSSRWKASLMILEEAQSPWYGQ